MKEEHGDPSTELLCRPFYFFAVPVCFYVFVLCYECLFDYEDG